MQPRLTPCGAGVAAVITGRHGGRLGSRPEGRRTQPPLSGMLAQGFVSPLRDVGHRLLGTPERLVQKVKSSIHLPQGVRGATREASNSTSPTAASRGQRIIQRHQPLVTAASLALHTKAAAHRCCIRTRGSGSGDRPNAEPTSVCRRFGSGGPRAPAGPSTGGAVTGSIGAVRSSITACPESGMVSRLTSVVLVK